MATISCPSAGEKVIVSASNTICVFGQLVGQENPTSIVVKVLKAPLLCGNTPPPNGTTTATITGTQWCATGVPVPSPFLGPMIVCAWEIFGSGAPTPMNSPFIAVAVGTPDGVDCCSGCSSASAAFLLVSKELSAAKTLDVTIADGPDAGMHAARAAGLLRWEFALRGQKFQLSLCSSRIIALQGPSSVEAPLAVEHNPFSAVFRGDMFRSKCDIVVTRP